MPSPFAHLHVHSTASDGADSPEALVQAAAALGYTALALTDHSTVAGHLPFSRACVAQHITPILGAELRVRSKRGTGHALVLAQTPAEYAQLTELVKARVVVSVGALKGLLVTSSCLGGVVARALKKGDYWTARDSAEEYASTLGASYYLEVQPSFGAVLAWVLSLADKTGIPALATNDVHYIARTGPLALLSEEQMRGLSPFPGYTRALAVAGEVARGLTQHARAA